MGRVPRVGFTPSDPIPGACFGSRGGGSPVGIKIHSNQFQVKHRWIWQVIQSTSFVHNQHLAPRSFPSQVLFARLQIQNQSLLIEYPSFIRIHHHPAFPDQDRVVDPAGAAEEVVAWVEAARTGQH